MSEGIDGGAVQILVLVALITRRPIQIQLSAQPKSSPDPEHSGRVQGRKRRKVWLSMEAGGGLGCRNMHDTLSEPGHPTE